MELKVFRFSPYLYEDVQAISEAMDPGSEAENIQKTNSKLYKKLLNKCSLQSRNLWLLY